MFRLPRTSLLSPGMRHLTALLSLTALLGGCSLPKKTDVSESFVLEAQETKNTHLSEAAQPLVAAHQGLSGIYALSDAHDAFAVRALLAQSAEKTLDIQYYIWRADTAGYYLLKSLKEAADRGVRVRLLLDDNGTRNLDHVLYSLSQHPNIEVRLFNPFVIRRPKGIGFFFDFERLNRRMHNKSFTADNTVTIVGGRNIGDEYFGGTEAISFMDLDVLALGEVVPEVSNDFDLYWNNESAYPIELLLNEGNLVSANEDQALGYALDFDTLLEKNEKRHQQFIKITQESQLIDELLSGTLELQWVKTEMVSDDPDKARGLASKEQHLSYQLHHAIGTPEHSVDLISPYFVPTDTGVTGFGALITQDKVRVRVLTNSYDATDVAIVHAGYMKHRKNLLRAGVELFELKKTIQDDAPLPRRIKRRIRKPIGIAGSSLHAKTFAVDGKRLFVGSFNFDPRSALLNTELGFVIHSPKLATQVSQLFEEDIPLLSYQVVLTPDGKLRWIERYPDDKTQYKRHETEPNTTLVERFWLGFLSRLPIEWML